MILALASGLALWLAFPSRGWWPLAPLGVAGLALAVRGRSHRYAALLGLITGLASFVPLLSWAGAYLGPLPWFALAGLESVFMAVLGALMPLVWGCRGGTAGTVLATAGLWVAQEAARSRLPYGGFPWARLAFSQADAPDLGYAALGGAPLVTAAVAAAGACLAVAVVAAVTADAAEPGPRARRALSAGVPVVAALLVFGGAALIPRPTGGTSIPVAAVQGNVPQPGLEFNARRRAVLDNHVQATLDLARQVALGRAVQPAVVLWPENASDIDPLRNADAGDEIQQAADAIAAPLLVGAVLQEPVDHLTNAGILWQPNSAPDRGPGLRYVKRHPAPFGEYIPDRAFFRLFSHEVDLVRRDFVAGDREVVMPAGPARLGDVICFEVAYDSLVRDAVRHGATLLVVQTNNATYERPGDDGRGGETAQQLEMSRVRAVEHGRAVVVAATSGVSAVIAPDGRVLQRSGVFAPAALVADVPLRDPRTLADRLGAWPERVVAALGMLAVIVAGGRRGSRRSPQTPTSPAEPPAVLAGRP